MSNLQEQGEDQERNVEKIEKANTSFKSNFMVVIVVLYIRVFNLN